MDTIAVLESRLGPASQLSGNEFLFECPGPDNCGRHLSVNIEKNVYFCVKCGFKTPAVSDPYLKFKNLKSGTFYGYGNIDQLKTYLGLNTTTSENTFTFNGPKEEKYFPLCKVKYILTDLFKDPKLLEEDLEYLQDRGFNSKIIDNIEINPLKCFSSSLAYEILSKKYTVTELKEIDCLDKDGFRKPWIKPNKILIPYISKGIVLGVRSKTKLKVSKAKYIWNDGAEGGKLIYNIDLMDYYKTILVTEGEFKAALPTFLGIPTVGLPGMSSGHEYFSTMCSLKKIKHVIICFDTEDSVQKSEAYSNLERAVANLKQKLNSLDIKVSRIELPKEKSDLKMDLDTYLLRYGIKGLELCFIKNDLFFQEIYTNNRPHYRGTVK